MSCFLPTSNVRSSVSSEEYQYNVKKRKLDYLLSEHSIVDKRPKLSETPPVSPVYTKEKGIECSLTYLDTVPANISKIRDTAVDVFKINDVDEFEHSDVTLSSYNSHDIEEVENFYINWRKNFEKWLLAKNPRKYTEFKNFLEFNSGKRLDLGSGSNSISEKINQYLVQKPVFNSKISKKFRNKTNDTIVDSLIRRRSDHTEPAPILLNPIHTESSMGTSDGASSAENVQNTPKTPTSSIRLPSINEILDSESLSVSKVMYVRTPPKHEERRSISTSSIESNNSVFSVTSKSNTSIAAEDDVGPQLSPPLIAFKTPSPKKVKSPKKAIKLSSKRCCLSCGSSQSPCWRPSWSLTEGQLCNSCGLRYKKTNARCVNSSCLRIPAKGEFSLIKSKANGKVEDYKCLRCGSCVEVN